MATATGSSVAGGLGNAATGEQATVSGGSDNTASGDRAMVPGGYANCAGGWASFAGGYRAKVRPGSAAGPASVVVVTLVLAYFTLVFGELAPKRVAMQKAERWGLLMARPLAFLSKLTRPVVWLLSHSTDIAVRLMGGDPKVQREEVTEEELRDMVAVQPTFTPEQRQTIEQKMKKAAGGKGKGKKAATQQ